VRWLDRETFAIEARATPELVEQLIDVDAIVPRADGRISASDEYVAATAQALVSSGIPIDGLIGALRDRRFGLRSLGANFTEPTPRTSVVYRDLAATMGMDAAHLPAVYAALGLPEPEPDDHPREDEAMVIRDFVRIWSLVDPTGAAHVRVARLVGEATRRIAEGTLDVWDEVAMPGPHTQGAPTVGDRARPSDPSDPEQNLSIEMAAVMRALVYGVHERQIEATLNARILAAMERVLISANQLPPRQERPPAIAFVDLSGYTSMTVERGDEAAAAAADRLRVLAEASVAPAGGRVVKSLGDGVLLRFDDAASAIRATLDLVTRMERADLPRGHAGIAAGRVVVRDGDVFGQTVNLASRIAAHAGAGEVVVEEGVVVALPRGTAEFVPLGRIELKGFPQPVALWRASAATSGPTEPAPVD
jgi:adenylate cyclase